MTCLLLLTLLAAFSSSLAQDCYTIVGGTAVYSGTTSVTQNNHTCQAWSSQSPNRHGYTDSYFSITNGDAGSGQAGASNYCRDPSGGRTRPSGYLWCYIASGNPRWEKCDVPKCPDTTTAAATTTASVTTTVVAATTVSVTTTAAATTAATTTAVTTTAAAATTVSVTTTAAATTAATTAGTTTASATTTVATTTASLTTTAAATTSAATTASVTTTAAATTTSAVATADCYTIVGGTAVYSGTTSVTTNNHTCQDWSSQSPNRHGYTDSYFSITNGDAGSGQAGASNYCRDPSGGRTRPSGYLWCYIASGNPRWEKCDVPKCPDTTTAAATTTTAATTTASVTTTTATTTVAATTASTTAAATTAGTTTTAVTTTAVATTTGAAATDCYTIVGGTAVYSGTTSVTQNNHTCQAWSSQSPNRHGYTDSYFSMTNGDAGSGQAGASNYCRDPSGGRTRPSGYLWCYIASGNPRWEKCDVPKCPDTTTAAATTAATTAV